MNITEISNNTQLQTYIAANNKVKYLFFWGHQENPKQVTKSCFSQWYKSPFIVEGIQYYTAEQYMMAEKARLFKDWDAEKKIVSTANPREAKRLGRSIRHFDDSIWAAKRAPWIKYGVLAWP